MKGISYMNEFSKLQFLSYECQACQINPIQRLVHDYELDFHYYGNSVSTIDGKEYHIKRGSMVMRRPGQVSCSKGDYFCRMITFDLSGEVVEKYGRQHDFAQHLFKLPAIHRFLTTFRLCLFLHMKKI